MPRYKPARLNYHQYWHFKSHSSLIILEEMTKFIFPTGEKGKTKKKKKKKRNLPTSREILNLVEKTKE